MTKDERDRAEARFNKAARAAEDAKTGKKDRDATAKAVLDNMARRRHCASPRKPPSRAAGRGGQEAARQISEAVGSKGAGLSDWLSSQKSGGRRT